MQITKEKEIILVLDFGSQYTQLIARRVREQNVYCEIKPYNFPAEEIRRIEPAGMILSGGPSSVYAKNAPIPDHEVFHLGIPILGICYGLQTIAFLLGGKVDPAARREYGHAVFQIDDDKDLFQGLGASLNVWMSHGDHVTGMPPEYVPLGHTENAPFAAVANRKKSIYGVQFHPEVVHTENGKKIIQNFLFQVCHCEGEWTPEHFIEYSVQQIQKKVGDGRVVCGLSGGVDSAVTATLIYRAIGERLIPIFVDNGLLRSGEVQEIRQAFEYMNLHFVDVSEVFLQELKGVVDPEKKRKIIGNRFIRVFEEESRKLGKIDFLAQGTLYPDVIESVSTWGPSSRIKSHHNVGGLPEKMHLTLVEPLRELFKDEVREVGKLLGLSQSIVNRHPFPGPGLAVRILGEVTVERLKVLRQADSIFIEELRKNNWYHQVWQALSVLLPVQTVGVMGDERTYENVVALRAVTSEDGMTADWAKLPADLLNTVSNRIINEIRGVNRVVYDISSKPPSTIEWE